MNFRQNRRENGEIFHEVFVNGEEKYSTKVESETSLKTKSAAILQLSNDFYDPADVTIEYFHLDKRFEWEEKADCQVGHEGAPDSERLYKIYKTESCDTEIKNFIFCNPINGGWSDYEEVDKECSETCFRKLTRTCTNIIKKLYETAKLPFEEKANQRGFTQHIHLLQILLLVL